MVNPLGFLFFVELLILKFGEEIQSLKELKADRPHSREKVDTQTNTSD